MVCAALAAALPLYVGIAHLTFASADAEASLGDAPALLPELLALLGLVVILVAPLSRNLFRRQTSAQSDVAALVGASRERVNQVIVDFKESGFISVDPRHHITVHDQGALVSRCQ